MPPLPDATSSLHSQLRSITSVRVSPMGTSKSKSKGSKTPAGSLTRLWTLDLTLPNTTTVASLSNWLDRYLAHSTNAGLHGASGNARWSKQGLDRQVKIDGQAPVFMREFVSRFVLRVMEQRLDRLSYRADTSRKAWKVRIFKRGSDDTDRAPESLSAGNSPESVALYLGCLYAQLGQYRLATLALRRAASDYRTSRALFRANVHTYDGMCTFLHADKLASLLSERGISSLSREGGQYDNDDVRDMYTNCRKSLGTAWQTATDDRDSVTNSVAYSRIPLLLALMEGSLGSDQQCIDVLTSQQYTRYDSDLVKAIYYEAAAVRCVSMAMPRKGALFLIYAANRLMWSKSIAGCETGSLALVRRLGFYDILGSTRLMDGDAAPQATRVWGAVRSLAYLHAFTAAVKWHTDQAPGLYRRLLPCAGGLNPVQQLDVLKNRLGMAKKERERERERDVVTGRVSASSPAPPVGVSVGVPALCHVCALPACVLAPSDDASTPLPGRYYPLRSDNVSDVWAREVEAGAGHAMSGMTPAEYFRHRVNAQHTQGERLNYGLSSRDSPSARMGSRSVEPIPGPDSSACPSGGLGIRSNVPFCVGLILRTPLPGVRLKVRDISVTLRLLDPTPSPGIAQSPGDESESDAPQPVSSVDIELGGFEGEGYGMCMYNRAVAPVQSNVMEDLLEFGGTHGQSSAAVVLGGLTLPTSGLWVIASVSLKLGAYCTVRPRNECFSVNGWHDVVVDVASELEPLLVHPTAPESLSPSTFISPCHSSHPSLAWPISTATLAAHALALSTPCASPARPASPSISVALANARASGRMSGRHTRGRGSMLSMVNDASFSCLPSGVTSPNDSPTDIFTSLLCNFMCPHPHLCVIPTQPAAPALSLSLPTAPQRTSFGGSLQTAELRVDCSAMPAPEVGELHLRCDLAGRVIWHTPRVGEGVEPGPTPRWTGMLGGCVLGEGAGMREGYIPIEIVATEAEAEAARKEERERSVSVPGGTAGVSISVASPCTLYVSPEAPLLLPFTFLCPDDNTTSLSFFVVDTYDMPRIKRVAEEIDRDLPAEREAERAAEVCRVTADVQSIRAIGYGPVTPCSDDTSSCADVLVGIKLLGTTRPVAVLTMPVGDTLPTDSDDTPTTESGWTLSDVCAYRPHVTGLSSNTLDDGMGQGGETEVFKVTLAKEERPVCEAPAPMVMAFTGGEAPAHPHPTVTAAFHRLIQLALRRQVEDKHNEERDGVRIINPMGFGQFESIKDEETVNASNSRRSIAREKVWRQKETQRSRRSRAVHLAVVHSTQGGGGSIAPELYAHEGGVDAEMGVDMDDEVCISYRGVVSIPHPYSPSIALGESIEHVLSVKDGALHLPELGWARRDREGGVGQVLPPIGVCLSVAEGVDASAGGVVPLALTLTSHALFDAVSLSVAVDNSSVEALSLSLPIMGPSQVSLSLEPGCSHTLAYTALVSQQTQVDIASRFRVCASGVLTGEDGVHNADRHTSFRPVSPSPLFL
ncbi:hypothetical protein KIPB_002003 [Kipferlia bialata]|uniref:Uncharacterized protein n=1 Tax=Kipferlia bialata TaxID=797122 RepID=A0A9K3CRN3_9EUKA|nr:hypothetical protein KIPB_002003 [Kipferlia bialata]|eukprot:g2003.t1